MDIEKKRKICSALTSLVSLVILIIIFWVCAD